MRAVVGAFNQHYSDETSKHTIRTMRANAAEGFYNGGPVPFGDKSVVVAKRGDATKVVANLQTCRTGRSPLMIR